MSRRDEILIRSRIAHLMNFLIIELDIDGFEVEFGGWKFYLWDVRGGWTEVSFSEFCSSFVMVLRKRTEAKRPTTIEL